MGFLVPKAYTLATLQSIVAVDITMKLYGNDKTPAPGDTAASYTVISGGGYVDKTLSGGAWTIDTSGVTPRATYDNQVWTFTGPIGGTGNIYGYFFVRASDGVLLGAERFPTLLVPFVPIAGSSARVIPRYSVASQF